MIREFAGKVAEVLPPNDQVLVLFEEDRVKRLSFGRHVHLLHTWAFMVALERLKVIPERSPKPAEKRSAGKWKDRPNATQDPSGWNGFFYFTRPESVCEAIAEWQDFTMALDPRSPEILRQLASHWMFEHIHPFHDGNGRVGRLLVPLILKLKKANRSACAFLGEAVFENKDVYVDALKEARLTSNWTSYIRTMLTFIGKTADLNIGRVRQMQSIDADWRIKLRGFRKDARVHKVATFALTNPAFTVEDAMIHTGGTYPNNNNAIAQLVKVGILTAPSERKRSRIFHADDVIDLFDRFKAPHPSP